MRSFFQLLRPIRIIRRRFVTKGLLGGDRTWLILGAIVMISSRLKSLFGFGEPEPVYTEELEPGQRFVLAHDRPARRRKRRRRKD